MRAYADNGVTYLVLESDLVASRVEEMRQFLMEQLKAYPDESAVVLDAQGIEIVDSLGVNLIIGLYKHVTAESKEFKIVNAGEKFIKVASFFRFNSIFPVEGR